MVKISSTTRRQTMLGSSSSSNRGAPSVPAQRQHLCSPPTSSGQLAEPLAQAANRSVPPRAAVHLRRAIGQPARRRDSRPPSVRRRSAVPPHVAQARRHAVRRLPVMSTRRTPRAPPPGAAGRTAAWCGLARPLRRSGRPVLRRPAGRCLQRGVRHRHFQRSTESMSLRCARPPNGRHLCGEIASSTSGAVVAGEPGKSGDRN